MTTALATINAEIIEVGYDQIAANNFATDLDLIEDWIGSKSSVTTRKQYRRVVGQFLLFTRKPIGMITGSDLQRWIDNLNELGQSKDSQRSKVSVVKALFSHAVNVGYTARDLVKVVKTPAARAKANNRIVEEGGILAALHNQNLIATERLLLNVLYYTGCRVSEATNIQWSDIKDGVLTVVGKGDKERDIKLPAKLLAMLEDARLGSTDSFIFATRNGSPITRQQANRYIKSIGGKCGIPEISCHWLRHCHASHALKRGADINLVSTTLGHSSVAVTSKYLHSSPDESSGDYLV